MRELSMMPWRRQAAIALAIGLVATLLGPFGTAATLPPVSRAAYWVPLIALGWVQFVAAAAVADRIPFLAARALPARLAAVVAVAALPTALEVTAVNAVFLKEDQSIVTIVTIYWRCALVGALIVVPMHLIAARAPAAAEPAASQPEPPTPLAAARFLERVPSSIEGRLLALEMEDHYLRVHTAAGSALILHRMSDAVAELAGIDGWRVHRSWWVAAEAVKAVRRQSGRATLVLENGLAIPVSRSVWPSLRGRLQAWPSA